MNDIISEMKYASSFNSHVRLSCRPNSQSPWKCSLMHYKTQDKSESFMIDSGYKERPEEAVKECLELLEAAKLVDYKCSDEILTSNQIAKKIKEKCEYIAQNYYTCSCRHQEECSCEWYYCNEIAKEINKRV